MNKEILKNLNLTEQQYAELVFNTGMEYIEQNVLAQWQQDIAETSAFWSWWKHQWRIIDDVFIAKERPLFGYVVTETLMGMYIDDHKQWQQKTAIHKQVWLKFHNNMMHQATKEVVR